MAGITPIFQLLTSPRERAAVISINGKRTQDGAAFGRDVGSLMARLKGCGGTRWLVLSEDAYLLAVGLLAGLHAGVQVVLPANLQPGHLATLIVGVDGVMSGGEEDAPADRALAILAPSSTGESHELSPIDSDKATIVLHTSGTSGEPLAITKPLRCLEAEVATLEALFGDSMGGPVLATVPPFHIYGLLFRILWPLSAGRPFADRLIRYPEELIAAAESTVMPTLISSPAFLRRALPVLDLGLLKSRLGAVFSSGGALPSAVAAAYNAKLRQPVVEVFGSTETGGIGYRTVHTSSGAEPWQPMPGVILSVGATNTLEVRSPFLRDENAFAMGDQVTIHADGRFTLGGRADRIVKLEELRVSLAEVEQRLAACPEVADCRVLAFAEQQNERQSLAAVIVPTAEGWRTIENFGKQATKKILRAALEPHLDAVALPRKWRFVRQLPETSLGKATKAALMALIDPNRGLCVAPIVVERQIGDQRVALRLQAQRDLIYFDGHFDAAPILPGVVQVHWALQFAREAFALSGNFRRLEALKLFRVIMAGQEFMLELLLDEKSNAIKFQYSNGDDKFSSGRIIVEKAS